MLSISVILSKVIPITNQHTDSHPCIRILHPCMPMIAQIPASRRRSTVEQALQIVVGLPKGSLVDTNMWYSTATAATAGSQEEEDRHAKR